MRIPRKTLSVALSCTALVCGVALAHEVDRGASRSSYDPTTHEPATRTFVPSVFPTAGGDSAEPARTGLRRYGDYAGAPHDDRWTPNPRVGAPLPSAGGDSAETDRTGARHPMERSATSSYDRQSATVYDDGMHHRSATGSGYVPSYGPDGTMSRYERTARFDGARPRIGDPFPTAGGDSAEPEKTGRFS